MCLAHLISCCGCNTKVVINTSSNLLFISEKLIIFNVKSTSKMQVTFS